MHPKLNNPIPRTEQSLNLKLARKATKRSKRDLRGLWETLAPGSTVVRTSDATTVIKEPGVPEVCVRNSDIAKFGTRAERNTDLWEYAKRRPLPYEKTTEEKISQYTKELKNSAEKLKSAIVQLNLMQHWESPQRTATSLKQWRLENLVSPKQVESVLEIRLQL